MTTLEFWRGRRVFVTGHTGFKGSWLCKILETLGAKTTGYALAPSAEPNLYDISKPAVCSVIGDIRDFDKLFSTFKEARPEIVIHMAAQPLVLDSYREPRYTYDVNVMGIVNILECIRGADSVRSVLNITTDKVYQNIEKLEGYQEDEKLNGFDPYSNSKSCSELVTSSYRNSFLDEMGIAVSAARSGNVIGGGDFASNRLMPDCAKALSNGEVIGVRNPDSVRPYLHVLDTIFAYLKIAQMQYGNLSYANAYNIGPGEDERATNRQLVDFFCAAWGQGASWRHIPTENPHESDVLKLDCSKIKRILGWIARWDTKRAVEETVSWYEAHYVGGNVGDVMRRQIKEFERTAK